MLDQTRNSNIQKKYTPCKYCGTPTDLGDYCCSACEKLDSDFSFLKSARTQEPTKFLYLDDLEYQKAYKYNDQFQFFIENLQCSSCVHLIEKIPDFYSECISARVHFGQSTLTIELTDKGSLARVAKIIEDLGYTAHLIKKNDLNVEQRIRANRADLKRIAVAGAVAGNLMIFSFAIYYGADGIALEIFRWMNFIIFLPLLFYSAQPFYIGAWNSLKFKMIHIDLPIVIALLSSTILSTYNLFRGSNDFYFDSTASFIFLILIARFFVKLTQQHYLSPIRLGSSLLNQHYQLKTGENIIAEQIKVSDVVLIEKNQMLPVDGLLLSEKALVDTSYYNGESVPQVYAEGLKLHSGFKCLSDNIYIQAISTTHTSQLNELLNLSQNQLLQKNNFVSISDELSKKLIFTVFSVAAIFFIGYGFFVNFGDAFNRALALIVVACPCALAFGSPLTMAVAFKKAQKQGIALRNSNIFEKLAHIKNIFFDKTGTLTQGQLLLTDYWPPELSENEKEIIVALEQKSYHPVAFALRSAWANLKFNQRFDELVETIGVGVRGKIFENNELQTYEIKSLPENMHDADFALVVLKNGKAIARLYFSDELREESKSIIEKLYNLGLNVFLLTGDKKSKALNRGLESGIKKENIYAELFPEDKNNIILQHQNTMMIGDGLNDSLALSSSDVGISIKGSSQLTIDSSDVLFLRGGLSPLLDLFKIGEQANTTLKRNLILALVYNSIAGTLALMGFINPFWAAVLMPISTFAVVISSIWGFRK